MRDRRTAKIDAATTLKNRHFSWYKDLLRVCLSRASARPACCENYITNYLKRLFIFENGNEILSTFLFENSMILEQVLEIKRIHGTNEMYVTQQLE